MTNYCYPPKPIVKSGQTTNDLPDITKPKNLMPDTIEATASTANISEGAIKEIITPDSITPSGPFCTYNADEIHTVEQYLKAVEKAYDMLWPTDSSEKEPVLWFRGLKSENYSLLPAIIRGQDKNLIDDENIFLAKFQAMAAPYLIDMPTYTLSSLREFYWRTLFLMQHYGIATRILDWTENALDALLFAIDSETTAEEEKTNPVVWCLNPLQLNKASKFENDIPNAKEKAVYELFGPIKTNCENKMPGAVLEEFKLSKIVSQKNTFTVFPSCQDLTAMERLPASETFLSKIVIARDCRHYLREQLSKYGLKKEELQAELIAIAQRVK